jgi:hypothetical protein
VYQFRYRPAGTATWTLSIVSGAATTTILNGLQPGTTYEYQMRAKCSNTPLTWSTYTPLQTFAMPLRTGQEEAPGFVLYPNPSDGLVNVSVSGNGTLTVLDVVGRKITRREILNQRVLTLTNLPEGMLTFRFVNANGLVQRGQIVVIR